MLIPFEEITIDRPTNQTDGPEGCSQGSYASNNVVLIMINIIRMTIVCKQEALLLLLLSFLIDSYISLIYKIVHFIYPSVVKAYVSMLKHRA